MRKLASIQKIKLLEPIPDADVIEKATVLGWQLVVKKGEFNVGDLCVYIEIDSILPDRPEFAFVNARSNRIKTIRLRGQVSQGICFPLSILPADVKIEEDADVTDVLDIEKYEPPVPAHLEGIALGRFPSFIPKTDETRVQVLQPLLDKYKGAQCYIAEKLDGTSVTFYVREGKFGVCSRKLELEEDAENTYWKIARELDIENKLRSIGKNIALQGEIIGENIQDNRLKLKGQVVYFFNLFDIDQFEYYSFDSFMQHVQGKLSLPVVPIIDRNFVLDNNIDEMVNMSVRKSVLNDKIWAEGIVIRSMEEKKIIRNVSRLSFKVINPEFLLKYGE